MDVAEWLHKATLWQEKNDIACLLDQQCKLTELITFLQRLLVELRQLGSVGVAVQTLPKIGQLLGRLCSLPLLLTSEAGYKTLISCVLFFVTTQPQSAVEARAKQWALRQLRGSVCYSQQEFTSTTLDVTGVTQQAFHESSLQEVAAQLASHFELSISSQIWPVLVTKQDNDCHLDEVCRLCLHLRHIPAFSNVLDSVMQHVWDSASRQLEWEGCLTEIMHTQSKAYLDDSLPPLPFVTQRLLWQLKQESLEQEVLQLVEAVTHRSFLAKSPVLELIKSRHLVKAIVEHFDIYEGVFSMLRQLYQDSHGANTVAFVIGCLHGCAREELESSKCDPPISILSHYSRHLQSLVTRLLVDPRNLQTESVECQLGQISQLLQDQPDESREEIHFILLQFPSWYHIALFVALTGTKSVIQHCINILTTLKCHSTHLLQLSLDDIVSSLRGLFNKSLLQSYDLTCAITTSQNSCCDDVTMDLIGQLLMFFLLFSSGGHLMHRTILSQVTGESDKAGHLECILNTLQVVTSMLPCWLIKPYVIVSQIHNIVDLLFSETSVDVAKVTGHEIEPILSPTGHCLCSQSEVEQTNPPVMFEQNLKPAVYEEQWKELVSYLKQIM